MKKQKRVILFIATCVTIGFISNLVKSTVSISKGIKKVEAKELQPLAKNVPMVATTSIKGDIIVGGFEESNGYRESYAMVTMYSQKDSCHYPATNGKCYVADYPKVATKDKSLACPNKLELGTRVGIIFPNGEEKIYTCDDRYSQRLDKERGIVTLDIFNGYGEDAYNEAIKWGIKKLNVKVYE